MRKNILYYNQGKINLTHWLFKWLAVDSCKFAQLMKTGKSVTVQPENKLSGPLKRYEN